MSLTSVNGTRRTAASKGKRVCAIAYTEYIYDQRVKREAEALVSRGDTVHFIGLEEGSGNPKESENGVSITRMRLRKYQGRNPAKYILSYVCFFIVATAIMMKRHLRERYDVIYVHTMPDFLVFASLPAKLLGARVVLNVHDTMPELWQSKFAVSERHMLVRMLILQERVSCWFADRVVAVHKPHRRLLEKRGVPSSKLATIMNLPDPKVFGPIRRRCADRIQDSDRPCLVYHGTVTKRLGLDIALRAFRGVMELYPNARFEIYGGGDAAPALRELIRSLKLETNVYFPNSPFRGEDLPPILCAATVGVIPNRSDAATQYMLPVKLLEYIHLGIPAVVPKLSAIQYYFDEDAVAYFVPGNVSSLQSAICGLLSDRDKRERLIEKAQLFCRKYSWDCMKTQLFRVLDDI